MVTQLIWPKNRKQNKAFVEYSIVTKPKYLYENLRGVLNLWKLFYADKKKNKIEILFGTGRLTLHRD